MNVKRESKARWVCSAMAACWRRGLIKWLPPICVLCGAPSDRSYSLCIHCEQYLPKMPNHCKICADILTTGNLCGACLKQPPPFDRLLACFPYVQPVVHFIWSLKFHQKLAYARLLGMCLVKQIQRAQYTCLPHYLIPVPLSFKRLQSRGFNQALEIARPISQALNIPIEARGVRRVKETPAQSGLSVAARKRNMRGAFVAMRSYRGAFVAVVDDVVTTQETVIVLCATLKKAGASRVEVWCAARALSCFAHVPQRESLVALD